MHILSWTLALDSVLGRLLGLQDGLVRLMPTFGLIHGSHVVGSRLATALFVGGETESAFVERGGRTAARAVRRVLELPLTEHLVVPADATRNNRKRAPRDTYVTGCLANASGVSICSVPFTAGQFGSSHPRRGLPSEDGEIIRRRTHSETAN